MSTIQIKFHNFTSFLFAIPFITKYIPIIKKGKNKIRTTPIPARVITNSSESGVCKYIGYNKKEDRNIPVASDVKPIILYCFLL